MDGKPVKKPVHRAVQAWRARTGGGVAVRAGAAEPDERLEELDAVLASPLGRAWITDAELAMPVLPAQPPKGVMAPLPRRKFLDAPKAGSASPPMARKTTFKVTQLLVFRRVISWAYLLVRYFFGTLVDIANGRNTMDRRAVRLRENLERAGPTFVKIGQHLSIRADLLPYVYCEELAKLRDKVTPFPVEQAVEAIARSTGKPFDEVFAVFDPKPIASASLSCVYQAFLHTGERVAVKVRRPGVGEMLTADMRAFSFFLNTAESLSIVRAGLTQPLQAELANMLFEEIDFVREARYTDLFRSRAEESGQKFITAPKVYFDFSGSEVIVTEFIEGVFMGEMMGALDRRDEIALGQLRDLGIDPQVIARRMVRVFNWETLESVLFHADPHPANIVVKPGNIIAFIDFGSCGRFSSRTRRLWHELHYHIANEDVSAVVATAVALLEPLPPIDIHAFSKELEGIYWDWLYAITSDHAEWWEKATGVFWMKIVATSRRYNVPMGLDTLRLFRTVFAYDSILYRLWVKLDAEKEYRKFARSAGNRARKRILKAVRRRFNKGLQREDYLRIEETGRMTRQLMTKIQHYLDKPDHQFAAVLGKAAFGFSLLLRMIPLVLVSHAAAIFFLLFWARTEGDTASVGEIAGRLVGSPWYQMAAFVFVVILVRRMTMRFEDPEVDRDRR